MPVVGLGDGIPGPVRGFEIFEDHASFLVLVGGVAPDVKIAPTASGLSTARALEPRMLVGSVIQNYFGDDLESAAMSLFQERLKFTQRAVRRMDIGVIGNIIAVVTPGR